MPKRYPEEYRRKVRDLQVSDQTIYGWRKQDLIDTGQVPGLSRL